MKIFVVDDNAEIRRLVLSVLEDIVDQFLEFDGAENIVTLYEQHKPDWVLMDIKMKQTNGISAAALLKQHYPGARIAILTNYGEAMYRIAARNAGAEVFLLKDDLRKLRLILSGSAIPAQ